MQHYFTVGNYEKHQVAINYEPFWGRFEIRVDSWTAISEWIMVDFQITRTWNLWIGVNEKHHLCIQKSRPMFLPHFKPHNYRIWIDNVLVHQFDA